MKYAKILVTLDGSAAAENVLPYIEELAARMSSQVILVSVSESNVRDIQHLYESYLQRITEQVKKELETFQPAGPVELHCEVLLGDPAREILRYADESGVDLIALTSRGSSGEGPWLLGNISTKILRATSQSVLLVRKPAGAAVLNRKRLVKRILAPLDGSELGRAALPAVEGLAEALEAEIVLYQVVAPLEVHSIYPPPPYIPPDLKTGAEKVSVQEEGPDSHSMYAASPPVQVGPRDLRSVNEYVLTYLESMARPLREKGLNVTTAIGFGYPADEIIDYAQRNQVDLIMVSSHGQSGFRRWVWGGVTGKLVHAGESPIMVVRAGK